MFALPDTGEKGKTVRGRESERVRESETSASPPPRFPHQECKVQFPRGREGKTTSTEVGYLYSGKEGQQLA